MANKQNINRYAGLAEGFRAGKNIVSPMQPIAAAGQKVKPMGFLEKILKLNEATGFTNKVSDLLSWYVTTPKEEREAKFKDLGIFQGKKKSDDTPNVLDEVKKVRKKLDKKEKGSKSSQILDKVKGMFGGESSLGGPPRTGAGVQFKGDEFKGVQKDLTDKAANTVAATASNTATTKDVTEQKDDIYQEQGNILADNKVNPTYSDEAIRIANEKFKDNPSFDMLKAQTSTENPLDSGYVEKKGIEDAEKDFQKSRDEHEAKVYSNLKKQTDKYDANFIEWLKKENPDKLKNLTKAQMESWFREYQLSEGGTRPNLMSNIDLLTGAEKKDFILNKVGSLGRGF